MPISSTRLSCPLLGKAYVMSPVGSAFDPGESASLYSTLIRPPPSSPCRIPPDLGSCRLSGVFIIRPRLPYRHGNCAFSRAPWLPDHYFDSPLLRAHPPPSRRPPLSR